MGRIDIWTLRTDIPDVPLWPLESLLAHDELERANRFRFDHLRRNYVLSRGTLRLLCSRYLKLDAASFIMRYGTKGKPDLGPECKLRFNLSHSGGITVYAFAWELEMGIDVEKLRDLKDIEAIVQRFFCPEEAEQVLALPDSERPLAFHTCWTRKEAFIKATGDGLSTALDSFRVNLSRSERACLEHVNFSTEEASRWTLQDLNLTLPYVGALCYRGPGRPVSLAPLDPLTDLYL